VYQYVAWLVFGYGLVRTFIQAFIAVKDVTGIAPHPTVVSSSVPAPNSHMTALALRTDISKYGLLWLLLNGGKIHLRNLFQTLGIDMGESLHEVLNVVAICLCSKNGRRTISIFDIVISINVVISSRRTPSPHGTLDFACFGIHDGAMHGVDMFFMALATSFVVDPHGPRIGHVNVEYTPLGSPFVGNVLVFFFKRVSPVTYNASIGIT
jgi:hypothetical protein